MIQKPLFIPLKAEYFEDFEAGRKTKEYRVCGTRWNERTCTPGREVTLSYGYGKKRRLKGVIKTFEAVPAENSEGFTALAACTGITGGMIAEIEIELIKN